MLSKSPVVITGASQRLGLAMAKGLIEQGHSVVVSYRRYKEQVAELEAQGVVCIQADFANEYGVQEFGRQLQQQFGSIRALIHNASEWTPESATEDYAHLMDKMMQIHVNTPYLLNMQLAPLLLAYSEINQGQSADIIHMTDYVAERGSAKHIAYAASKAALANLSLSFASRYAPHIKVNNIAPSLLMFQTDDKADYRQKALAKSLMQIEPGAREAVEAVSFILHSNYLTGRTIELDGGRHLQQK